MDDIKEISVDDAKRHLADDTALFVDVRDPGSFQQSCIKGAINVNDDNLQTFLKTADRKRCTIVYCFHGNMSRGGAKYLSEHGFENVFSLSGGYTAWEAEP